MIEESVELLNKRLKERYGNTEDRANYRIVWSEDELEMRQTDFDDKGQKLLMPEVRQLPKYKQWIQRKWLLERLTVVPVINEKEIPTSKLSYEPLWVFEDGKGNPLMPAWVIAEFCIDSVHQAMREAGVYTKYHDEFDGLTKEQFREKKLEKIDGIVAHLWPNESDLGDALSTKNAISMAGLDGTKTNEPT